MVMAMGDRRRLRLDGGDRLRLAIARRRRGLNGCGRRIGRVVATGQAHAAQQAHRGDK